MTRLPLAFLKVMVLIGITFNWLINRHFILFFWHLYSFLGHSYYSYLAVFLIQAFLSSLGVVFVFLIGKRVFNPLVGIIAALITSFYWPFITVTQDLVLENLVIFMPLLFMVSLLRIESENTLSSKIVAGVVMALTTLTKGIFLLVLPLLVFLWFKLANSTKDSWKTILIIYLVVGSILSLWLGRNFLLFKQPLFSSQSGASLWIATHPDYGTYSRKEARIFFLEQPELNEVEKNTFYAQAGMENLKKYPQLYFKRVVKNWQLLFYQQSSADISVWLAVLTSIGLILALFKKNRRALVLWLFFILFLSQYALLFAYPRFRMPLDWILILLAAYAVYFPVRKFISPKLDKYIKAKDSNWVGLRRLCSIGVSVLGGLFLIKIGLVYLFPKKAISLPSQAGLSYLQIYDYQKKHQGNIEPFLEQKVIWIGEVNYLNHNALYPLGSAKHPEENSKPEYAGFYDTYYLPSTTYSTFDLTVNRGKRPGYYGDGVVMVNYKGSLLGEVENDDMVAVSGKIIGQNSLGQIYVEGYEIYK